MGVTSNKAFKTQKKVRSMAGPVKYSWTPTPSEKRKKPTLRVPFCDNRTPFDDVVTYVYEIDPSNGRHIAYVDCDYVD
jgi:hypothetical protein